MKLRNQIAIITGGSRGIGRVIAEFFVREGATVVVFARKRSEINEAIKQIERITGSRPLGVVCDVSSETAVRRAVQSVAERFHRIDVLVNCAGIQAPIGPFIENNMGNWEKNIAINLLGTVYATHAVVPFMIKKRYGSIINFSGGGATSSRPNFSAYAAAKIGVVKFTEILADELSRAHIRVNAIAPGAVNTAMLKEVLRAGKRAGREELASAKKRAQDGGTSPDAAAALAVFLASRESAPLSGRLVSAPWDDWRNWNKKKIKQIMQSDSLKLRRMK